MKATYIERPGTVVIKDTPIPEPGPNGSISEIPGTVAYLPSDDSSYVAGVNIPIFGGIR